MTNPKIEFIPEPHSIKVNGITVPTITQILEAEGFIDKSWYDEDSRDRGTHVHLACHLDNICQLDEESVDPIVAGYLESWRKFKRTCNYRPQLSEQPLGSDRWWFGGVLDSAGRLNNTGAIVEIKTGIVEPWVALQTAAQEILLGAPHKRFAVQLFDDGTLAKLTTFTNSTDANIFQAALSLYNWKKNNLKRR